jgi:DNA replication protein DnaD
LGAGGTAFSKQQKKNYAGSKNHFPHGVKEKYATLVPSTVKLLYRQTKKAQSEKSNRVPEGRRSHKETGVTASNKQEHQAQTLQS